jgi:hypothetical protein
VPKVKLALCKLAIEVLHREVRKFFEARKIQGQEKGKKAPEMMSREVRLEQPVNELLEDYARFIESSPDHVINAVLKKVLWRDLDYRKWRGERRAGQPGADKPQPVEGRGRI